MFRAVISKCRYRIKSVTRRIKLIMITETDLWECWQRISHYRYRFSIEFPLQILSLGSKQINSVIMLATLDRWQERKPLGLCSHVGPHSPQKAKTLESVQKVGFPPVPERAPKERFCTLLGTLSGIGGNPAFLRRLTFSLSGVCGSNWKTRALEWKLNNRFRDYLGMSLENPNCPKQGGQAIFPRR